MIVWKIQYMLKFLCNFQRCDTVKKIFLVRIKDLDLLYLNLLVELNDIFVRYIS